MQNLFEPGDVKRKKETKTLLSLINLTGDF